MVVRFQKRVIHYISLLVVVAILSQSESALLAQLDLMPAVDASTRKWGFMNDEEVFVIPPMFDLCGQFVSDIAPVMMENGWGYVSPDGKFRIQPIFQFADEFSEGVAGVINKEGKLQYIDVDGHIILNTEWMWGEKFSEGEAVVKTSAGGYVVIDINGTRLNDVEYKFIGERHLGLAPAQRTDDSWTYLSSGKELPTRFQYAGRFSGGFATVLVEGRYGLIHPDMKFAINPEYDFAINVKGKLALTRQASNVQMINLASENSVTLSSISVPDLVSIGRKGLVGYALGGRVFACGSYDVKGIPSVAEVKGINLVEVGLSSNKDSIKVYRPSKWDYVRAEKSGAISKLLTPDFQCPSDTDCSCSLNRFTEYRIIFVWEGKKDIRSCIPSRDTKVRGTF